MGILNVSRTIVLLGFEDKHCLLFDIPYSAKESYLEISEYIIDV